MTYQKPTQHYDDNADADESSSLFLTATDASSSSVLRQEEVVAKKKKLLTALAVGVATGILLLVVAGDYYSVVVAPAAAANGGSTETIVELPVGGDKFGTCYTPEGTFNGWTCDNAHGPYRDGCIDTIGHFKRKDGAFETCFGLGGPDGSRCWSKSHYCSSWGGWYPCVPRDLGVHGNPPEHWYVAQPRPDGSCGVPCGQYGFNERVVFPLHNIGDDYEVNHQIC